MCSVRKELILDFRDIRCIDVECDQCGIHVVIDVTNNKMRAPGKCPSCQREFDSSGVQDSINAYITAHQMIGRLKQKITIHVPIEDASSK